MKIEKALTLKKGDLVNCPADRGNSAFTGRVCTETDTIKNATVHNSPITGKFIWIEVKGLLNKSVWPSNRLG